MNSILVIEPAGDQKEVSTLELGPQDEFDSLCEQYRLIAEESEKVERRVGQSTPRF